jgi:succinyl-CoA synthetase alpha subunit
MKTTHALIIGCAIILGFALHAYMSRYEHNFIMHPNGGSNGFVSRADKLTGEINVSIKKLDVGFTQMFR